MTSPASSTSSFDEDNRHLSRPRKETIHLTPYASTTAEGSKSYPQRPWISTDPRSSSTQSLIPSGPASPTGKRTLLLIYIHGFLGNEASFQSFPAHVHNLLRITLVNTHRVHTKIYPRYKSRKAIDFARDDFSKWLAPHESPDTDLILLGHSMGGILAAEVTLLPPLLYPSSHFFRHQVLGTINFDTPFLGMHPGVIVSGIGSLFKPAQEPPPVGQRRPTDDGVARPVSSQGPYMDMSDTAPSSLYATESRSSADMMSEIRESRSAPSEASPKNMSAVKAEGELSPFGSPSTSDQDYNPRYANDILLPVRKGWDSALHFITKHSDGLATATMQFLSSHLEFGGCLADYPGLRTRYAKIRGLEDVKEQENDPGQVGAVSPPRVRFVNYYTTSTGRIKSSKSASVSSQGGDVRVFRDTQEGETVSQTVTRSPRISVEEERDGKLITHSVDENGVVLVDNQDDISALRNALSVVGIGESSSGSEPATPKSVTPATLSSPSQQLSQQPDYTLSLPPIPPPPQEPPFFIPTQYPTKEARKSAEREHAAQLKAYKQAVREHNRVIKERTKLLESSLKRKLRKPQSPAAAQPLSPTAIATPAKSGMDASGKGRERRFCVLPPKINGRPDTTWISVHMEGVDEVGAHCGLFFLSQTYEMLVGDVAGRVEDWVKDRHGLR
ncbi:MAG: hypothetical protein M1816_000529 [Peltula sp. TS41687]|nr:MAG: hypothetical protein M1816_000529 [Peltula sp. TS41687]